MIDVFDECAFTRALSCCCAGGRREVVQRGSDRARPRVRHSFVKTAQADYFGANLSSESSFDDSAECKKPTAFMKKRFEKNSRRKLLPIIDGQFSCSDELKEQIKDLQTTNNPPNSNKQPRRRGCRAGKGQKARLKKFKIKSSRQKVEKEEKFISLSMVSSGNGDGLVVGFRSVLRALGKGELMAVVMSGRGVPIVASRVLDSYCLNCNGGTDAEIRAQVPLYRLVETSCTALGRVVGLPHAMVIGFHNTVGYEYLAALAELK